MSSVNIEDAPHLKDLNIKDIKIARTYHRILRSSDKRLKYVHTPDIKKTILHWGQRKLLINEIEFLTDNYKLFKRGKKYVLYIGSAPGIHLKYLFKLFPTLHWIFYDPRKYCFRETDNVKINNKLFLDEDIDGIIENRYNKNMLFISDIRSGTDNESILFDMELQKNIHLRLNPLMSHLKFRLPWEAGKTEYLLGDIYFQPWVGPQSTETRLVTNSLRTKKYDHKKYEEQMFYFNKVTRRKWYKTPEKVTNLGHCYDCYTEYMVLKKYIETCKKIKNIDLAVNKMVSDITKLLSPTGKKHLD